MMQLLDPTSLSFVLGEMAVVLGGVIGAAVGLSAMWTVKWLYLDSN